MTGFAHSAARPAGSLRRGQRLASAAAFALAFHTCAIGAEREPLWELGAFGVVVSQQAYPGSDQNITRALVLPFGLYRGRVLRADEGTVGVRAVKTPTLEVDVGFAGAFGSSSSDIEVRRGMPNLGTLVEFGPRLKWNVAEAPDGGRWRVEFPLRGVFDLNDRLAARGLSFEPEVVYERRDIGPWDYSVSAGAVLGNERLNRVFYEVEPRFATGARPVYAASAGLIAWRLGVSSTWRLGRDWRVFGFLRADSVAGAANRASPLVRRTSGLTGGLGVSWTGLRSEARAAD